MKFSAYSAVDVSSVLRSTYTLLSLTLLWTAALGALGSTLHFSGAAYLGLTIAGLVALFVTMALRNSVWGLLMVFVFTGIEGLSLGPVLTHYLKLPHGGQIITIAVGLTGVLFMALSGYVLVTRKNFEFLGGLLFIALLGMVLVSLVGLFFPIPLLHLALAFVGVLVFSGYVLYDTSRIVSEGETNYIMATIALYLDILNLFLSLLKIIGFFASSSD